MFNLLLAIQYLPAVIIAVKAVEDTVHAEVPGTSKRQIIIDSISVGVKSLGGVVDPKILAGIGALIDAVVGVFNIVGVFKKKEPAPAAV
jgi:hypothetical protein